MTEGREKEFLLSIPLDATSVSDRETTQEIKVVAKDREGTLHSTTTKIGDDGKGVAKLKFPTHPGPLYLAIGPADASDDELMGLQTLTVNVVKHMWGKHNELKLRPVTISAYYWFWWRRWCRTFVIRGKVVCPNGNPVPGAEVCIFDVDSFFIWHSTQKIGCVTTDIDGTFEYKFRWCCGWWPWWWWRHRVWQLDDILVNRVAGILKRQPNLTLSRIDNQPSLAVFDKIIDDPHAIGAKVLKPSNLNTLPSVRDRLLKALPSVSDLSIGRIWPWYPWYPWWDCNPDIIFKVTQDCDVPNQVILEETVDDTRWNVPTSLDVTLVTTDNSCCVAPPCPNPPCDELDCLVIDQVCSIPFSDVGGNGGTPGPIGYAKPGPVPINSKDHHRPFGGIIPIYKNPDSVAGVDYYEIEYFDDDPAVLDWVPLPAGAAVNFYRRYWGFTLTPHNTPAYFPFQNISGHNVVESRSHFETTSWPPGGAIWLTQNYSLLLPLDTTKFPDGTYRFHVVGWQEIGGALTNRQVLPVCDSQNQQLNEFVLTFDNRTLTPAFAHDPSHNCGEGVHYCTTEPDTHILAVRVNGVNVNPCDTVGHEPGTMVEIDFLAQDSDEHLGYYELYSLWGLSHSQNLLKQPGASVVALTPGAQTGWLPGQDDSNYGTAVFQGAPAPHWVGGRFRLTLPLEQAFPDPCCYQLRLTAYKRTIVGHSSYCNGYWRPDNGNRTEYSLGVGVCP